MKKLILFIYFYLFVGLILAATDVDILIMNLKNRQDKRKLCDYQMKALGIKSYKYIVGFNGKEFMANETAVLARESGLSDIKIDRYLVPKENANGFGCLVSHMKALKDIIIRNITHPVLIMEDDFLADGMAFKVLPVLLSKLPADWDIFYPGHCESQSTCGSYLAADRRICKSRGPVACAHSFMVNGTRVAQKMYDALNQPHFQLADLVAQKTDMNRYVLFPSMFTQIKRYMSVSSDIGSGGGVWAPLTNTTIADLMKKHVGNNVKSQ